MSLQRNIFILLAATLLLAKPLVYAQQIKYQRHDSYNEVRYQYTFKDARKHKWELDFTLPLKEVEQSLNLIPAEERIQADIQKALDSFVAHLNRTNNQRQQDELQEHFRQLEAIAENYNADLPHGIRIWVKQKDNQLQYGHKGGGQPLLLKEHRIVKAKLDKALGEIQKVHQQFRQGFEERWVKNHQARQQQANQQAKKIRRQHLASSYLVEDEQLGFVRLDYSRIAKVYQETLAPLALRFSRSVLDDRARIQLALNFFQAIPYSQLRNRNRSGIAGFVSPPALLHINQGDCDTKATAMSAVLAQLVPQRQVVMVLIKEHAFLGVALTPQRGDVIYEYQGLEYVLMEPAGPALLPLGKISRRSKSAVKQAQVQQVLRMG